MSNILPSPALPSIPAGLPSVAGVKHWPLYLESLHEGLFAWLHEREDALRGSHGVVICPPIGHEQVHSHRGLRHLADALARAGFPTLRLDYHGTGDSAGSDEDPARCATWLANIRDAEAWMRQLGCERISLAGLRMGAALALQTTTSLAVDGLILWSPVLKGRAYVREMKALSLTASSAAGGSPAPSTEGDVEAAGFLLTEQTILDLSLMDLLQARPLCRRVLILARDDMPQDSRLLDHLRALGIERWNRARSQVTPT
jgi:pimeloyl-ACP methyl ester carboxylesterase